jgi:peptidoglycan/xylan/chitin deacetylase (PgdA/CDA1 family)
VDGRPTPLPASTWRDNYEIAFPLLQRYDAIATVFLVTSWIGRDDMLDADRIAQMESAGIAFGSHTVTHALLGEVDRRTMQTELADSKAALARYVRRPSRWFCFPKGSHNREACDLARQFYDGAVTVRKGWVDRHDDRFTVKRVGVHNDVAETAALLASRITFLL